MSETNQKILRVIRDEFNEAEFELEIIRVFRSLNEDGDMSQLLRNIAEIGKDSLDSSACTLSLVDLENKFFTIESCIGFDKKSEEYMVGRKFKLASSSHGDTVDYDLIVKGELIEEYDFDEDGKGFVNPKVLKRNNLRSAICYPFKSGERLVGYFNHFSTTTDWFEPDQRIKGQIFASYAAAIIDRLIVNRSLQLLNELAQSLTSMSSSDFLLHLSNKACELLKVPVCIVWKFDQSQKKLNIIAAAGSVVPEYKELSLDIKAAGIQQHLNSKKVGYILDVTKPHKMYQHSDEAMQRGWVSLLSAPMWVGDLLIGMLNVYTTSPRVFKNWEKELFYSFANQAAVSIQKAKLLKKTETWEEKHHLHAFALDKTDKSQAENELYHTIYEIVKDCAAITSANSCCLRLFNNETDKLELKAIYPYQDLSTARKLSEDEGIAGHVAETGEHYICNDTSQDTYFAGFKIGNSILTIPIKSGGSVIGTISVGSEQKDAFDESDAVSLQNFVESVPSAIERASLRDILLKLAEAMTQSKSLQTMLNHVVQLTRELMKEPICLLWLLNKDRNCYTVRACAGPMCQMATFDNLLISNRTTGMKRFLSRKDPLYLQDASAVETHPYKDLIKGLNWKSMLSIPLWFETRVIGILTVYSYKKERDFTSWHKKLFKTLSVQASIAIENFTNRKMHEKLHDVVQKMTEAHNEEELLNLIIKKGLDLVRSRRGWISRLDFKTGELRIWRPMGGLRKINPLRIGEGITGRAIKDENPIRVNNVHTKKWQGIYKEFWKDTRSEIAIPILIKNTKIREGNDTKFGSKPIGVLNIESPTIGAFTKTEEDILWSLSRHAAIMIDRLEFDEKLSKLSEIEKKITAEQNWEDIVKIVLNAITDILQYEYVNISLVKPESNRIKTEHVFGFTKKEKKEFKEMADHSLDSTDIQAHFVKNNREIEVPDKNDIRFDSKIEKKFNMKRLIRVFIPMRGPSSKKTFGTVEAGYQRKYRPYIYEQDVQILKGLVEYVAIAYEQKTRNTQMEKFCHEFRAPIVGARINSSFLQRRLKELDEHLINRKLNDTLTDCDILIMQVKELEHILGGSSPIIKFKKTDISKEIIMKTMEQLKPVMTDLKLDPSNIYFDECRFKKVSQIYTNKAKLNEVVFNLIMNSIKYSEDAPDKFKLRISLGETAHHFIVKFEDWGLGIQDGLEEKIFEERFRAPDAAKRNVTGSGLGLTISKKIMSELGGDLKLENNRKPTEFHLLLPKKPPEGYNDTVHR